MSEETTINVRQYLRYFKNEDGKKALDQDNASKWIASGKKVTAVLTNLDQSVDFETEPLSSVSYSMEERNIVLCTVKRERYYVKKKLPGYRFIEIHHFTAVGQEIPKEHKKDLSYVKNLVKKGVEVHGVFYESRDCKTISSKIIKVDLEENSFETDTHIKYQIQ